MVSDTDSCAAPPTMVVMTLGGNRVGLAPLRHGGTLNSHRAVSPLVRLVEWEERWETLDHPPGFLPQNWGRTDPNHTVTCVVLKATANDRRTTIPLPR
ncbi:uncharacterized protein TNCV_4155591 [Trichonephila clavipes]|nr:uncharacterized protein TNCV_4155591 [Trichonephila clavipes]